MTESDGIPDAVKQFSEHDPGLEPYASMTREGIQALMDEARAAGDLPVRARGRDRRGGRPGDARDRSAGGL
jgi:hypothetical protein